MEIKEIIIEIEIKDNLTNYCIGYEIEGVKYPIAEQGHVNLYDTKDEAEEALKDYSE